MTQAKYNRSKHNLKVDFIKLGVFHTTKFQRRLQEGLFIVTLAVAVFLLLSLLTYHANDPSWSCTGSTSKVANAGGYVGSWSADILLCAFGYMAYVFPFLLLYASWMSWRQRFIDAEEKNLFLWRTFGFLLILLAGSGLFNLCFAGGLLPFGAGGVLGNMLNLSIVKILNFGGAILSFIAFLLIGVTIFTGLSWLKVLFVVGRGIDSGLSLLGKSVLLGIRYWLEYQQNKRARKEIADSSVKGKENNVAVDRNKNFLGISTLSAVAEIKKETKKPITIVKPPVVKTSLKAEKEKQMSLLDEDEDVVGTVPALSLLDVQDKKNTDNYTEEQLAEMSRNVELKLKDFGIDAQVVAIHPGPVVTRFELQLAAGTKVSRITGLSKDLARSLSVLSVRVVEVIPGKSVIGLELPNSKREIVRLREVLAAQQYEQTKAALALALGKDISGLPVVVDLARMPHLLVAGTTGSGKSVCLNALLLSLLYKYTPQELRLILIDPKMLELSIYEGIPHLLVPVVTNMKEAANSLRWCVGEMERRYKLMMSLGVRNIAGYNHKIREARGKGKPLLDPLWQENNNITADDAENSGPAELSELPYIVVFADEYADMIMVVGKKVEELIARIAQKARAAGIHLILATQRPSVDVITGLIKANIPSRIAFQVSSKIDSRTILDQSGAEQLLGHGDMLYLAPGSGIPVRVHGAFVADEEVHRVVHDWQKRGRPEYIDEILDGGGDSGSASEGSVGGDANNDLDVLYDQAVYFVTETRKVSVSSVQRRFKIGYNRAARIVESMEAAGVVGPMEGNGNREVLAPPPVAME